MAIGLEQEGLHEIAQHSWMVGVLQRRNLFDRIDVEHVAVDRRPNALIGRDVGSFSAQLIQHFGQELHQLDRAAVLAQVADGAAAQRDFTQFRFGQHAVEHESRRNRRSVPEHDFRQLIAAEPRHVDVEHDDVRPLTKDHGRSSDRFGASDDLVACTLQVRARHLKAQRIIVDEKDAGTFHAVQSRSIFHCGMTAERSNVVGS